MQVLRFYSHAITEIPIIFGRAALAYISLLTSLGAALGYFGIRGGMVSWWGNLSPWWGAVVPVVAVAGILFLIAIYRQFEEVEAEKDALEAKLATEDKRLALLDALGTLRESGEQLAGYAQSSPERASDLESWVRDASALIEAAFGKGMARRFLSNEGYTREGLHPRAAIRKRDTWMDARLWRLEELIGQVDSLSVRPDFDPRDWT